MDDGLFVRILEHYESIVDTVVDGEFDYPAKYAERRIKSRAAYLERAGWVNVSVRIDN